MSQLRDLDGLENQAVGSKDSPPRLVEMMHARAKTNFGESDEHLETENRIHKRTLRTKRILVVNGQFQPLNLSLAVPEPEGAVNVWVGVASNPGEFNWLVRDVGLADTAEHARASFLSEWYALSKATLAEHVGNLGEPAPPSAKRNLASDTFELVLVNACAALGWASFFGGTRLHTEGVDFVAFDEKSKVLFAVSVTIGTEVVAKARRWLAVQNAITAAAGSKWQVQPVIVTAQPASNLVETDKRSVAEERIQLITGDQLACLRSEPPDLVGFEALLHAQPSHVDPTLPFGHWPVLK
jgi:hypothetical protein